jgi:hypothetical protein
MVDRHDPGSERRLTLGADKAYDTSDFVDAMRQKCVTPHVAQKIKGSAIEREAEEAVGGGDARQRRFEGYQLKKVVTPAVMAAPPGCRAMA